MRIFDKTAMIEEELQDMKLRFQLLEGDRKAYYESSQWTVRQNKEEIQRLKAQNKQLAEEIALIRKKYGLDINTSQSGGSSILDKLEQRVCDLQKRFDESLSNNKMKESSLKELQSELEILKREEDLIKATDADSEINKEIQSLENKLDKALIKFNESLTLKKIYEQIIDLMQQEKVRFDTQLETFEKTLKIKRQDATELEAMAHKASHAKEIARNELAKLESRVSEERKMREREVYNLKELIKQKRQIDDKPDKKQQKQNEEQIMQNNGDSLVKFDAEKERKLSQYEETMKLIKEATGVSNLDEVVQKFQAQQETHEHLTQLKTQYEQRLSDLKSRRAEIVAQQEELKFSGKSKHSSALLNEIKERLLAATAQLHGSKHRFEKSNRVLSEARIGVQHIAEKLEGVQLTEKYAKLTMNDETMNQILEICTKKIGHLVDIVQAKESNEGELAPPPTAITQAILPAHNARVKPQNFQPDGDDDEEDEDEMDLHDRELFKRATAQIINAKVKGTKAKKSRKRKDGKKVGDDDDSD